jgi:hypothetical protein
MLLHGLIRKYPYLTGKAHQRQNTLAYFVAASVTKKKKVLITLTTGRGKPDDEEDGL